MTDHLISRDLLNHLLQSKTRQAYEEGQAEGRRVGYWQGYQQGAAEMLALILQHRFGTVDEATQAWLAGLSAEQLRAIAPRLSQITRLSDVQRLLDVPAP